MDKNLGFRVIGYVAERGCWDALPYCGSYEELDAIFASEKPDEVVVALPTEEGRWMGRIINACEKDGTKLSVVPSLRALHARKPPVRQRQRPAAHQPAPYSAGQSGQRLPQAGGGYHLLSGTHHSDLAADADRRHRRETVLPGPIIFRQERVGKDKKELLHVQIPLHAGEQQRKHRLEQKRGTTARPGSAPLIRKCSVDELPQFFNVLKGDMSLIGPGRSCPFFVEQFKEEIPPLYGKASGAARHHRLGAGQRPAGRHIHQKRIEYDLYYIENWTPAFDLRILIMTAFCMFNKEKVNKRGK